jgi:type I restriction enzyme, S subunit
MTAPSGIWPVVPLFEICSPKQWPTIPESAFLREGYPVYGANGRIGYYSEFNHEEPTVLITCRGATCGTINVCEPKSYVTGNAMALDNLDERRVNLRYLVYALRNGTISKAISGTAQPQITRQGLTAISIPLPPLSKQLRIAEILDRAEALRVKRHAALAQLDTLTQSIFVDLFGDPILNSKDWKLTVMANAVLGPYGIKAGPFGSSLKKEEYATAGYRVYGQEQVIAGRFDIGDYYVNERKYQQLKTCAVSEGDLLISLVGSFGKILVVPKGIEPGIINPRLLKITPDHSLVTSEFLSALLMLPRMASEFKRVAHGGTMGILNAQLVKQLQVILPPLDLQAEFKQRMDIVRKLQQKHYSSLTQLDVLFAALRHRAFRGEI